MPIDLTVPEHGYTQVKVVMVRVDLQRSHIFLTFCHGDTVEGAFVPGLVIHEERLVRDIEDPSDPAYTDLIEDSTAVAGDEVLPADGGFRVYAAASRNFYEHALARGWYVGTVA